MSRETKLNVLCVDDRPENLFVLENILTDPDMNLVTAESGNEALGLLIQHDFAVALLDVQMPDMDGFEVAELMRSNERTQRIPIIFLTAISKESEHVFRGYETGAVDYIFKPFQPEVLKSKVRIFCDLKKYEIEQQHLKQALEQRNTELKELDKLKSEFLSTASHELRTPLTIIQDFVSIVHDGITGEVNEEQQECLSSVLSNCTRLGTLINDLLDLQKISSGQLELHRRKNDIGRILTGCHKDLRQRCNASGQSFELELEDGLPPVYVDPNSIVQVVINLVGNAIKFTPRGGKIVLSARVTDEGVQVDVRDTGPGIEKIDQDRIFQSFTQVGRTNGPGPRGTGLGLAISAKIVNLHDGRVWVESDPGTGSVFSFTLPVYNRARVLRLFLQDRINSDSSGTDEWVLLLIKAEEGEQRIDDRDLEKIARIVSETLRREKDTSIPIEEMGLIAVLVKAGSEGSLVLQERIEEALVSLGADGMRFSIARHQIVSDSQQTLEPDPDEMNFCAIEYVAG